MRVAAGASASSMPSSRSNRRSSPPEAQTSKVLALTHVQFLQVFDISGRWCDLSMFHRCPLPFPLKREAENVGLDQLRMAALIQGHARMYPLSRGLCMAGNTQSFLPTHICKLVPVTRLGVACRHCAPSSDLSIGRGTAPQFAHDTRLFCLVTCRMMDIMDHCATAA